MGRKILSKILVLVMILLIGLSPQVANADSSSEINTLKAKIENSYNIKIKLSSKISEKEEIAIYALNQLNDSLEMMPKGLVKKLVKHHKSKGKATTVSITSKTFTYGTATGLYDYDTNTVTLYVPSGASLFGSGLEPLTITHEFGHMLHFALEDMYGSKKLKSEFTKLNNNIKYGTWEDDYYDMFTWKYAATNFAEDFAETFAYSVCLPGYLQSIYIDNPDSELVKKSDYIYNIIKSQFKTTPEFWNIYPQEPSRKVRKTLETAYKKGNMDFTNTMNYQYKIRKIDFIELINATLFKAMNHVDMELNEFSTEDNSKQYVGIKRKDAAKILIETLEFVDIKTDSKDSISVNDCNKLSKNTMKNIKAIVNSGLLEINNSKFYPEAYLTYEQAYRALIKLYDLIIEKYEPEQIETIDNPDLSWLPNVSIEILE